ncbi:hypothetical protein [Kutzneria sp. CA-103260]|uniref:hypothetical protein n=1 Tax=Kutzneria sp. CA-103260 TaxID=2802641 RepID=UPI001BAD8198|nr:hypothetical protein [Kutzneria sp. CA-103260]QUQ70724.1 hypothetical protein JJ691_85070 [Kutzneria sp. CA-103260]
MSGEAERADHGRHRRLSSVPPPLASRIGLRSAHAKPVLVRPSDEPTIPLPAVPPIDIDPVLDTDPVGLRKFDIGTVPASVTPPRTWRRAAWFTVGSSAAALIALVVVGTLLVGPSRMRTQIESFPGNPFQVPLPTTTDVPTRLLPPGAPSEVAATGTSPALTPAAGGGSPTATSGPHGGPTHTTPQPTITTVTGATSPVVDPGKIAQQTQHFFAAVTSNVGEAYQLTSGALKANGEAALQQRYQDVASVQVQGITIDPGKGITINTVLVTRKDGSTNSEQHVLAFTPGTLPLISEDTPVGG